MTVTNERSKQLFDETVNYQQTVRALVAFSALVVHDGRGRRDGAEFGVGRRMTRMPDGLEVTPDVVAQKSRSYGVAAEVKKSLGVDQARWTKTVTQAGKYRARLKGWFTRDSKIKTHDAVVLIHQSRARQLARFIEDQVRSGKMKDPQVALVEFNESSESAIFYFFRLERGSVSDEELSKTLEFGKSVPIASVLQSFANLRYYDSAPPTALLLSYLWGDYFPSLLATAEFDEKTRVRRIRVNVQDATRELQRAYGSGTLYRDDRSVEFPRVSWILSAFDRLRKFGLAKPVEAAAGVYDVYYRGFKKDVLQHFCELEAGVKEPQTPKEMQPGLFDVASEEISASTAGAPPSLNPRSKAQRPRGKRSAKKSTNKGS